MRCMVFGRTLGGGLAVCGLSAAVVAGPPVRVSFTGGQMTGSGNPTNIPQNFAMVTMGSRGGSGGGTTGGGLPCAAVTTPMAISISDAPTSTTIALRGVLSHGTACPASSSATANYFSVFNNPPTFTLRERTNFAVTNASTYTIDGQAPQTQTPVLFRRLGNTALLANSGVLTPGQYTLEFNIGAGNQGSVVVESSMDWQVELERVDTSASAALDYDGDGKSDLILHNTATGSVAAWTRNPAQAAYNGFITFARAQPVFRVVATGDFDGDGLVDVLWQHTTNATLWIWYTDGAGVPVTRDVQLPTPLSNWRVRGVGDFNGDTKPDILFDDPATGYVAIWYLNNASYVGWDILCRLPAGWGVAHVADLNGDNAPDLVCRDQLTLASNYSVAVIYTDLLSTPAWNYLGVNNAPGQIVGVGDCNDDGVRDIIFNQLGSSGVSLTSWRLQQGAGVYDVLRLGASNVSLGAPELCGEWTVRN